MRELEGSLFGVGFRATGPAEVIDRVPLLVPYDELLPEPQVERGVHAEGGAWSAEWPERGFIRFDNADSAALSLASELELSCAARSPRFVVVHAGVVAVGSRALLLPGRSMVGKSTLTAALVDAGADYLSDEYALIDDDGLVHPYSRSIRLRDGAGGHRRVVPVPSVHTVAGPCRTGLVASLAYGQGWSVTAQASGDAVLSLLANAVAARLAPRRCADSIVASMRDAEALAGERGDAADAARRLLDLLSERVSSSAGA